MKPQPKKETGKPEQANSTTEDQPSAADSAEPYEPPEIMIRDSDEFIRSLGPAQACSPSPLFVVGRAVAAAKLTTRRRS